MWLNNPLGGEADVLRRFGADIEVFDPDDYDDVKIGSIEGLVGWFCDGADLFNEADGISGDVAPIGAAADEIRRLLWKKDFQEFQSVLFIEMIWLKSQWRGRKLVRTIIEEAARALTLNRSPTLVALVPEPQKETGGPMPKGPERTGALRRLRGAYEVAGFRRWKHSTVWWRLDDVPE